MRRATVFLSAATIALSGCATNTRADLASAPSPIDRLVERLEEPRGDVMVVAHRGCWREVPENSIPAIEACIALGVEMVELDVHRTADGALIVMHDDTVDRTTNGTGPVSALTLAQVRELKLRKGLGGPDAAIMDVRVPTFREALEAARGRVLINVDAKADVYADVAAALSETDMADHVLMKKSARPADPLLRDTPVFAQVQFMPIVRETWNAGPLSALAPGYADLDPVAYEVLFDDVAWFAEGTDDIAAQGERVWVNTLSPRHAAGIIDPLALEDPDATWGRLIDAGADMIQTDEPEALIAYLAARRAQNAQVQP